MHAARISSKGQMVVPKQIRDELKIKPGTFFSVRLEKGSIVFTPVRKSPLDRLYRRYADKNVLRDLEREHAGELEREDYS